MMEILFIGLWIVGTTLLAMSIVYQLKQREDGDIQHLIDCIKNSD